MDVDAADGRLVGFKRHLRVEIMEGVGAFLFSENGVTALRGERIEALAALLDGTRDIAALIRETPEGMETDQVTRLIRRLVDAGLVGFREPDELDSDERALAYWDACGLRPSLRALTSARVGVVALGGCTVGRTALEVLAAAGLNAVATTAAEPPVGDLTVVLSDDYLNSALAEVDSVHRAAGVPWLLAKPDGMKVWVGPFFEPGESACWHCLASRLWQHRRAEACAQTELGRTGPASRPPVTIPALNATATQLVGLEVTKWLSGHRYPAQHDVLTLDSTNLLGVRHELRRRPQCSACGDPSVVAARAREAVVLQPARKAAGLGGGFRTLRPEQILERFRPLVSPVTGVVKAIERDPRGPTLINSFRSGPNLAAAARGMGSLRRGLRAHSGGKGVTELDAEVGALCEAIERHSATFHGDEEKVTGSLRALGEQAIDPQECLLFDDRQYADRTEWNRQHGPFQHVFPRFDETKAVSWTPVWSLTENRHRYLPTAMLYLGAPTALSGGLAADSNGNAAGSSLVDAVLQGALELIERDAVALWWYNRTSAPGVDLAAFDDPWITEVRSVYKAMGRQVWVLDVTSDLCVPAMVAVSRRIDGPREDILFGCGAHVDPHIALRRALAELNQLVPAVLDGGLETLDDPDASWWWRNATVANQPYLVPAARRLWHTPSHYAYQPNVDIKTDVDQIVAKLAERGMDMLVLDQTRPDIGLPVVKVIVPGLRHFWARFAPGRLFDVPVALGRLSAPTRYEDLNPVPFFL